MKKVENKIENNKFLDIYILRIINRSDKAKFHPVDKTLEKRIVNRLNELKRKNK